MSATDSDNSIDWLASDDDDDNESEREPDCTRRAGHAQAPNDTPSPGSPQRPHPLENSCSSSSSSTGMGEGIGSEVSKASSGCTGASDGNVCGVCPPGRPEKSGGRSDPQSLKRPRSSVAEQRKEREFTSQECEKDQLFTRKCMELQCYIHPLSLILNGLRSGRYRERLSSFQESVAMDRIQRIMGVLQNPCMGERYVNIILKMEDMLKSWFPNVKPQGHLGASQTEEATPTKKLKIAPVVTTALTVATANPVTVSAAPPHGTKALSVTDLTPPGAYSASNLKWLHTSPICSPTAEQAQAGPRHLPQPPPPPPPAADRTQTQDNAVSSTTDHSSTKTDSIPRGPPPLGKINAPCLERLLRSTESIISCRGVGGVTGSGWS